MNEEEVVAMLKKHGLESEEAHSALIEWTKQNEAMADKENTAKANAECALKQARLYYRAGYIKEALEELEISRMEARNRQDEELYQKILDLMGEIEAGKNK